MSITNGHPHPLEHEDDRAVSPQHAAIAALATMQNQTEHTHGMVRELHQWLQQLTSPADMETVTLTAATPVYQTHDRTPSPSLGLLNPTGIVVYLGVGGATAQPGRKAVSCPPASSLVLPVSALALEVGADPADLAAGDATVHVFRFPTVQTLNLSRRF